MTQTLRRLTGIAMVVLLGACAGKTLPPTTTLPPDGWQHHQATISKIEEWVLDARVSVNTEDKGWSGKLQWHQQPDGFQIRFNAPLGQGAFRLTAGAGAAQMQTSDGDTYQATDAETLVYEQLGWRFPLQGLRYWVMGVPDPASEPLLAFDQSGHLASMRQDHWTIRYRDYMQLEGLSLPRKVYLENPDLKVRLVVDRWQL